MTCRRCNDTEIITDCRGARCSHVSDREWPCPLCTTAREVGPEPEWLDNLDALFESMLRHPAGRAR
jgi:hypothetical protein